MMKTILFKSRTVRKLAYSIFFLPLIVWGLYGCYGPIPYIPWPTGVSAQTSIDFASFKNGYSSPGALAKAGKGLVGMACQSYLGEETIGFTYYANFHSMNLNSNAPFTWHVYYASNTTYVTTLDFVPGDPNNQEDDLITYNVPNWGPYQLAFGLQEFGSSLPQNCAQNPGYNTSTYPNPPLIGWPGYPIGCYNHTKWLDFASGYIPTSTLHVVFDSPFIFQCSSCGDY